MSNEDKKFTSNALGETVNREDWEQKLNLRLSASEKNAEIMNLVRSPSPKRSPSPNLKLSDVDGRMHRATRLAHVLHKSDTASIGSRESEDDIVKRKPRKQTSPQRKPPSEFPIPQRGSSQTSQNVEAAHSVLAASFGGLSTASMDSERSMRIDRPIEFDPIPPDFTFVQLDPNLTPVDLDRGRRALADLRAARNEKGQDAPFVVISRVDSLVPTYKDAPRSRSRTPSRTSDVQLPTVSALSFATKSYRMPFSKLDNSLVFHLKMNVLTSGEDVLHWQACSSIEQPSPYLPDDMVAAGSHSTGLGSLFSKKKKMTTPLIRAVKELPCWMLVTSHKLYIFRPTFAFPFSGLEEGMDAESRFLDPLKFMQLTEEHVWQRIMRMDVGWLNQTVTLHVKTVVEKRVSYQSITYLCKTLEAGQQVVTALKSLVSGQLHPNDEITEEGYRHLTKVYNGDLSKVENGGGWWSLRNCNLELGFPLTQDYTLVQLLQGNRAKTVVLMATCDTIYLLEQRWDVWPPLLFPPEVVPSVLGDAKVSTSQLKSTAALNALVGKQLHKGLLVDFVGEFELLDKMSRSGLQIETQPIRKYPVLGIQVETGWISQGQATMFPPTTWLQLTFDQVSWDLAIYGDVPLWISSNE
jgi:hypothetical protein